MGYGLDQYGFEAKPFIAIKNDTEQYIRENFKYNYSLRPDTVDGMIILVFVFLLSLMWQQLEAVYNAFIPSKADGISLDNVNELRGIYRRGATKSSATVKFYGLSDTFIPEDFTVSNSSTADKFTTLYGGSIPVTESGYGYLDLEVYSNVKGPIPVLPNTIDMIETPLSGLLSVINEQEGKIGREVENDIDFRTRANIELALYGKGTLSAIKSNIVQISNIIPTNVTVKDNDTNAYNEMGRPPKSFEAIIIGGDDYAIAEKILDSKPAGIQSFSTATLSYVPEMTSNSLPYGLVTPSSETTSFEAYKAFDGNTNTYWKSAGVDEYLTIEIEEPKNILTFSLTCSDTVSTAPKYINILGSNNNSTWVPILSSYTQESWTINEEREFIAPYYSEKYKYFKVVFTEANGGDHFEVTSFKLMPFKRVFNLVDEQNVISKIQFSRPQEIPIFVKLTIAKEADAPLNYDDQVKQKIVDLGNSLGVGKNATATSLYKSIYEVTGTSIASLIKVDTVPNANRDIVTIGDIEIPTFSVDRIDITYA